MMNALYSAATGMVAQQASMDVIANNLANVNTAGYKSRNLAFQDLLYENLGSRQASREGAQVGMGVAPGRTILDLSQGNFSDTDSPTNMAIDGNGFFQVQVGSQIAYTRDGNFSLDANGQLVTGSGHRLYPGVIIPDGVDINSIKISAKGSISGVMNGARKVFGQVELAIFTNPNALQSIGENMYVPTSNSGTITTGAPGVGGKGIVRQSSLEDSNVSVMEEMIDMISAQRAFESVSKVMSTSDEMMQMANAVRR
jgi:flagellar basal-body rod protein FlgG